ncbi:MAG: hypothetical protein RJA98_1219 [Pseudomonadota bacterium]
MPAAAARALALLLWATTLMLPTPATAESPAPDLTAASAAAQVQRGQVIVASVCVACHSLDDHRTGPALRGVLGRVAGTAAGFEGYSPALRSSGASGQRWTAARLRAWLTDPEALVPGQAMGFSLSEASDRDAVLAYLASLSPPHAGR